MMFIERAGIGVLLKDVQGHPLGTVLPDHVEQQRPDALTAGVRPQIQVLEHLAFKGGIAEDLRVAHRHPNAACPEYDVSDPLRDLLMTAPLRRQVRHGSRTRGHVNACDHRRVRGVREPDLGLAVIAHHMKLQELSRGRRVAAISALAGGEDRVLATAMQVGPAWCRGLA